jgi:hypothetical protein
VIRPGGVGFETSSAKGHRGAVLVANSTRPVLHGVSVLLIGNWLGLQISKPDDNQVNANGEFFRLNFSEFRCKPNRMHTILEPKIVVPKLALTRIEAAQALGLSPATIDRLTARGLLRPSRATYRPIYAVTELQRFLNETSKADYDR